MKVRNGFVSNSSSSSFFAVISVEVYKEFVTTLNMFERDILDCMKGEERKIGDASFVLLDDHWNTEEPHQVDILEEIIEDMGLEWVRNEFGVEDWVDFSSECVRADFAVGTMQEIMEKIRKLEEDGKAIACHQYL
jgi:hypothetical protein